MSVPVVVDRTSSGKEHFEVLDGLNPTGDAPWTYEMRYEFLKMQHGSLYPALHRLEQWGWVSRVGVPFYPKRTFYPQSGVDGRHSTIYCQAKVRAGILK